MKNRGIRRVLIAVFCLTVLLRLFSVQTITAATNEQVLQNEIDRIVAGIPSDRNTDALKALYLHDYVVNHVTYVKGSNDQNAYGALIEGKAVCAGYTDAYRRLLDAVGIRSEVITGQAYDENNKLVAHAWSMVWLNGKCYFTDVTWDDPFVNRVQELQHTYFNISLEQISLDHFPDDEMSSILPSGCNHTGLDYYTLCSGNGTGIGIFNEDTTPDAAAKAFISVSSGTYFCDFRFDGSDLKGWVQANWFDIAQSLGLSGSIGCSYSVCSNTCSLTLTGKSSTQQETTPSTTKETEKETESTEAPTEATKKETKPAETEPSATEKASVETTKSTEATKATQPDTETKPTKSEKETQPAETKATQPTQPTQTEPVKSTEAVQETKPSESSTSSHTTQPTAQSTEPPAETDLIETEQTALPSVSTHSTETAGESAPSETGQSSAQTDEDPVNTEAANRTIQTQTAASVSESSNSNGGVIAIVLITILLLTAAGIFAWGWYKKKKNS